MVNISKLENVSKMGSDILESCSTYYIWKVLTDCRWGSIGRRERFIYNKKTSKNVLSLIGNDNRNLDERMVLLDMAGYRKAKNCPAVGKE